jgi:hypothetical protein
VNDATSIVVLRASAKFQGDVGWSTGLAVMGSFLYLFTCSLLLGIAVCACVCVGKSCETVSGHWCVGWAALVCWARWGAPETLPLSWHSLLGCRWDICRWNICRCRVMSAGPTVRWPHWVQNVWRGELLAWPRRWACSAHSSCGMHSGGIPQIGEYVAVLAPETVWGR